MTVTANPRFDDIFEELASRTDEDGFVDVSEQDLDRWASVWGLAWPAFLDAIAVEIAVRYHTGKIDFALGDSLTNDFWCEMVCRFCDSGEEDHWSSKFYEVYDAFDAGEFAPGHTPEEAVVKFTNPAIAQIVKELTAPSASPEPSS